MQPSGSAEADECEVAWIVTALHGYQANSLLHSRFGQLDDARGEGVDAPNSPPCSIHIGASSRLVQPQATTEKILMVQATENQIRIGNSGLIAGAETDGA